MRALDARARSVLVLRVALLVYLAYAGSRTLTDSDAWHVFGGLTLGVHELGHVLFSPFGEWLGVAGGSITQLAAPIAAAAVLMRQGDWFGVGVVGTWEAYSLTNLATYVGDASAQELPLVGLSDEPMHDWNYLLGRADLLSHDQPVRRTAPHPRSDHTLPFAGAGGTGVPAAAVCHHSGRGS